MNEFIIGYVFGAVMMWISFNHDKVKKTVEKVKQQLPQKAQFLEPKSFREKFKDAKNISELE